MANTTKIPATAIKTTKITEINPYITSETALTPPMRSDLFNIFLYTSDSEYYDLYGTVSETALPTKSSVVVTRWKYGKPRTYPVHYVTSGELEVRFVDRPNLLYEIFGMPIGSGNDSYSKIKSGIFTKILIEWFTSDLKYAKQIMLYNCVAKNLSWGATLTADSASLVHLSVVFSYDDFKILE